MSGGSTNVFNPIPTKPTASSLNNQFNYSIPSNPSTPSPSTPLKSSSNNTTFTTTTSLSTSNSTTTANQQHPVYHIPSLDLLINDCFLKSIDHLSPPHNDDSNSSHDINNRLSLVDMFENFITSVHSQENLYFLIEIFKYEYYYENIFPHETLTKIQSDDYEKLRLNNTPSPSPAQFIPPSHYKQFETSSTSGFISPPSQPTTVLTDPLSKTVSIRSEDLDPNAVFVSTIDDLDPSNLSTLNNNIWNNLKSQNIDDDEDDSDGEQENDDDLDDNEDENATKNIDDKDRQLLNNQWNLILNRYVIENAPDQINISQKLHDQIIAESNKSEIHQPLILLKAKNEVYQIIKENTYLQFIKQLQQKPVSPMQTNQSQRQSFKQSPSSLTYESSNSPEAFKTNLGNPINIDEDQLQSDSQPTSDNQVQQYSGGVATMISNPTSPSIPYMSKHTYKLMKNKLLSLTSSSSSSSSPVTIDNKTTTSSLPGSRTSSPPVISELSPTPSFVTHSNPITINRAHTMSVPHKSHHNNQHNHQHHQHQHNHQHVVHNSHHTHTSHNILTDSNPNSNSNSISSSSISNLLGHFKISSSLTTASNSGASTPSNLHSLTTSPVSERGGATAADSHAPTTTTTTSSGLKFWSSRKKT